jgi:hypothetical protein
MKYLNFNKSYPVEDSNFGWIVGDNGEAVSVPFEIFFKGIILGDDRWGKNIKTLTMLMDVRDKFKNLSYHDSNDNKILELTDEEWALACEICENPQNGFNVQIASALFAHIKDLKEASNLPLNF